MTSLSSKEKAALRGNAQALKPSVFIGRQGLQDGVARELQAAFARSTLVKVAFKATREELPALIEAVERVTGSECIGGVGRRRSFFRPADPRADSCAAEEDR